MKSQKQTPDGLYGRVDRPKSHYYFVNGQRAPSVTTILGASYPKQVLGPWQGKMVRNVVLDLLAEGRIDPSMSRREADEVIRKTVAPRLIENRDRGTRAHLLIEDYFMEPADPTADARRASDEAGYLAGAILWAADHHLGLDYMCEVTVLSQEQQWGGTVDMIASLGDGRRWIIDWKTSAHAYPDYALQLYAYMQADYYIHPITGDLTPLSDLHIEAFGVVRLDGEGGYEMFEPTIPFEELDAAWRSIQGVYRYVSTHGVLRKTSEGGKTHTVTANDVQAHEVNLDELLAATQQPTTTGGK